MFCQLHPLDQVQKPSPTLMYLGLWPAMDLQIPETVYPQEHCQLRSDFVRLSRSDMDRHLQLDFSGGCSYGSDPPMKFLTPCVYRLGPCSLAMAWRVLSLYLTKSKELCHAMAELSSRLRPLGA